MSANRLERLLRDIFEAQGLVDAARIAHDAAEWCERASRDQRIYELRASHTEEEVAERFGISQVRVRQIVRRQLLIRRKAS